MAHLELCTRVPAGFDSPSGSLSDSPRQNRLLAALPKAEYERLLPALDLVPLSPGSCLHASGDRDRYLYFPASGIVAQAYVLENGAQAGVSLIGNDGAVGVACFLSGDTAPSRSVVVSAGRASRLRVEVIRAEFARFGALAHLLLRYTLPPDNARGRFGPYRMPIPQHRAPQVQHA